MTAVRTTPEADEMALSADHWWLQNRPKAPLLFTEEYGRALSLLEEQPRVGPAYSTYTQAGVRRLLLQKTRFHLYYTYDTEADEVVVVAVWSAQRGRPPMLGP